MKQLCACFLIAVSAVILQQLIPAQAGLIGSDCVHNNTHNFTFGKKLYYDRQFYHDHINLKSKFMRVQSVDVTYPPNGTAPLGKIDYIEALDQRSDGTGGCVYIKNGGVGSSFVTLHVKTQRNHGMEFFINVYGH